MGDVDDVEDAERWRGYAGGHRGVERADQDALIRRWRRLEDRTKAIIPSPVSPRAPKASVIPGLRVARPGIDVGKRNWGGAYAAARAVSGITSGVLALLRNSMRHEDHLLVADIFQVVDLELAGPVHVSCRVSPGV